MPAASLTIPAGDCSLPALLWLPPQPRGLVVFVHGSGSNRFSPRNQSVALVLQRAALATVLFDLCCPAEVLSEPPVAFSCDRLCARLLAVCAWLTQLPTLAPLGPVGLFAASSGAAPALQAAAQQPETVAAVVSRGGRPDLAVEALSRVQAPTLLIVGGEDRAVLQLNRAAAAQLRCPHRLEVIPGAGHLFEQPGTLEQVAALSRDWFLQHLRWPRAAVATWPAGGIAAEEPWAGRQR